MHKKIELIVSAAELTCRQVWVGPVRVMSTVFLLATVTGFGVKRAAWAWVN